MLETHDLILDKAEFSDYRDMYNNIWKFEESARYMQWSVTPTMDAAKERILRTIAFQRMNAECYTVYLKANHTAIGFAGFRPLKDNQAEECGIAIGPSYIGKGYGTQVLDALLQQARSHYHVSSFYYHYNKENIASYSLQNHFGFIPVREEKRKDIKTGEPYILVTSKLDL